ncbi:MAG: MoaD/ThiS family protein [Chloroflexi bacterium]|nr:MoaD/ThiS family protein [Chloroflexota bacterium]MBI4505742.1 MoaD/ThiS family protein [Chloroflexota bacterium]
MTVQQATIPIESVGWVNRFVGGSGSGRIVLAETLRPGDTVRSVLRRVSAGYPQLDEALWDAQTGDLGEHIEVVVNDAVLDISHSLDSPLTTGDRITLVGQYIGG